MFKNIILIVMFVLGNQLVFAQDGNLEKNTVETVDQFTFELQETEKVKSVPALPKTTQQTIQKQNYSVETKRLNRKYPGPKIKPVAMKKGAKIPIYDGFAKIGYGTPKSPYGEAGYFKNFNKNFKLGLHLKHHSANNETKWAHQKFADTNGSINGTYRLKNHLAVKGNLGYARNEDYYYGYDHKDSSIDLAEELVLHQVDLFKIGVKFFNMEQTPADLNYYVSGKFSKLDENFATNEFNTNIQMGINKVISYDHLLDAYLETDFNKLTDTTSINQNIFKIGTSFAFNLEGLSFRPGVRLIAYKDKYFIMPDLFAEFNLLGNKVALFAGWEKDITKNTFQSIHEENPFILSKIPYKASYWNEYFGGVRGEINGINYQFRLGAKQIDDMPLFVTSTMDTSKFDIIFDSTNLVNTQISVGFEPIKKLKVELNANFNSFHMYSEEQAWYKPQFSMNINSSYATFKDKMIIKLDWFIENGLYYKDTEGNAQKLNALFDINFGAEYWLSKRFGLFLNLNNLADNKRQRWVNYPTYGFNILGGFSARF